MTTASKTYSKEEYDKHGNIMYDIGLSHAFKTVLKTDVSWSVQMPKGLERWDLDTVIIGDGSLKNIPFVNNILTMNHGQQNIVTRAKNGTVKEVWLAADRAFKKAKKLYGDWHCYLEIVELNDGVIYSFYGS